MSVGVGWKTSETGAQGAYGGRRCSDSRTGGLDSLLCMMHFKRNLSVRKLSVALSRQKLNNHLL